MPVDYEAIRHENQVRYGTDIGRIGPMLLSNRYGDRTHFIYELPQNAEDALARREGWNGSREISFSLGYNELEVSHFGRPFDEGDIRAICGIALSEKGLTLLGRFGIGFKSVYSFTDSPEIHSGQEHFAIDSYVLPKAIRRRDSEPEKTLIRLPFSPDTPKARQDIQAGLQGLNPQTLLFLREIEAISWCTSNGHSGLYLRSNTAIDDTTRKVMIIGEDREGDHEAQWEQGWIIFSRPVSSEGTNVGYVEIAFALDQQPGGERPSVRRLTDSRLVAFFPTILPTNLGFLIQGPYRTTPSRDNVPEEEEWNRHLVQETSLLLVGALQKLREFGLLNVATLQSLPLNRTHFGEGSRFASLFTAVRDAVAKTPLIPGHRGGYFPAKGVKLARTQELRELFSPAQLGSLYGSNDEIVWVSEEITPDRTPTLRRYLIEDLGVDEVTPEVMSTKLTRSFLEAQPDVWIERLYGFLVGKPALLRRLRDKPLVRLHDGSHTVAFSGDRPQAFLPGTERTSFPTVRKSVCQTEEARTFLKTLGLTLPDLVDDVIANVLPKYRGEDVDVPDSNYRRDIKTVLTALDTDSSAQRQRLIAELQKAKFIRAVDTGSGYYCFVRPESAYMATQRMRDLFSGVAGVLIVDQSKSLFHKS